MRSVLAVPAVLAHLVLMAVPAFAVVGGGEITMQNKGGSVVFSHELHVDGLGNACQACHPKLYTTSKQHKPVTMKAMQAGTSCGACHNGAKAFSVKGNCAKCHTK
ncbi:MAG: cytochrome c3 family protein [Deltaproteobacteria bacterium]|nr:cytochrome c3 family protein [Deltaproteobacteria bacterium]